jgi:ATP-dependent DNA helicase RecQ
LNRLLSYCDAPTCRHRELVRYFGQDLGDDCESRCDVCGGDLEFVADALVVSQKILSSVHRQGQRFGAAYTAQVLTGASEARVKQNGHDALSTFGLLSEHPDKTIISWIGQLTGQGYLERYGEHQQLRITESGRRLLKGAATPRLTVPQKKARSRKRNADETPLEHPGLFEELRQLRRSMAESRNVPPYVICGDATLKDLARLRPSKVESLTRVSGIGSHKQSVYGQMFVDCIVAWCGNNDVSLDPPALAAAPEKKSPPRGRSSSSLDADKLFEQGLSVAEVVKKMGRAQSTVSQYLSEYLAVRQITDATRWIDRETCESVAAAIAAVGPRPLKPLFDHLEGAVPYDTLRIVVQCWENQAAESHPS